MPNLERGFKSWAERAAQRLRQEVGVEVDGRLAPFVLAEHLGILVLTPKEIPGIPARIVRQLLERDPSGWSAVSLVVGQEAVIIPNPTHSEGRQASNLCHEIAHFVLGHTPGKIVLSQDGQMAMRSYDAKQEEEANWLAGCLLLQREGLLSSRRTGMTASQIARHFGVSERLVNYRLHVTGVEAQLKRAGKRRGSRRGT